MRRFLFFLILLVALAAPAQAAPSPSGVTEISLERTPCFGACPVDRVTLRADGTASYEGTRFVGREGRFQAELPAEWFQHLAAMLRSHHFFGLRNRYEARISDLPTHITSVKWAGGQMRVENYGDAGPSALWQIEVAIRGVTEDLAWQPETPESEAATAPRAGKSGIAGTAIAGPISPVERSGEPNTRPLANALIVVRRPGGAEVSRTRTDIAGHFSLALPPGSYLLVPLPPTPGPLPRAESQQLTVRKGAVTHVEVRYDTGIR